MTNITPLTPSDDVVEGDPWSKFRFWLGVTVVGFLLMSIAPQGAVSEIGAFGCCFGLISATIAAIAASQSKGAVTDASMMPVMGGSGHQAVSYTHLRAHET